MLLMENFGDLNLWGKKLKRKKASSTLVLLVVGIAREIIKTKKETIGPLIT